MYNYTYLRKQVKYTLYSIKFIRYLFLLSLVLLRKREKGSGKGSFMCNNKTNETGKTGKARESKTNSCAHTIEHIGFFFVVVPAKQ